MFLYGISQNRLNLIHFLDDLIDRRACQSVVENIGAGLNVFDRNFILEVECLVFGIAGIADEDMEALLPGMIADTLENTQARANAYVSAMNKSIENAIKAKEKDDLDGTGTPGSDNGGDGKEKTEAEKFAESFGKEAGESAKVSADIVSSYLD